MERDVTEIVNQGKYQSRKLVQCFLVLDASFLGIYYLNILPLTFTHFVISSPPFLIQTVIHGVVA